MFVDGDEDSDCESDGALPVDVHVLQAGQRRRLRRRGRARLRSRRAEPLAALQPLDPHDFCKDERALLMKARKLVVTSERLMSLNSFQIA